jgi:nucleoid DNA-binding protein
MSGQAIVDKIAVEFNLPTEIVKEILHSAWGQIENIARETGRCQVRGFGVFMLHTSKARVMHDYATRQLTQLQPKTTLKFRQGRDRISAFNPRLKPGK